MEDARPIRRVDEAKLNPTYGLIALWVEKSYFAPKSLARGPEAKRSFALKLVRFGLKGHDMKAQGNALGTWAMKREKP